MKSEIVNILLVLASLVLGTVGIALIVGWMLKCWISPNATVLRTGQGSSRLGLQARARPEERTTVGQRSEFAMIVSRVQAVLSSSRPGLRLKNVLVPLDFTESSVQSLTYAAVLGREFGCSVTLLHVVHLKVVAEEHGEPLSRFLDEMKSAAERTLREAALSLCLPNTKTVVRIAEPAVGILKEVAESDIDLIIMGRHRRKNIGEFLSPSIVSKVRSGAPCPTLLAT